MASFVHLIDQRRLIGPGGSTVAGDMYFYYTGTTVLAPIYYDGAMTVPAPNPISVAAGEIVPLIYLDDAIIYRRVIVYSDGTEDDQDPLGVIFSEGEVGVPVGAILPYAGTTAPDGFLLCDGSAVSRATYPDLFSALGITYGAGDGSTTFNLPDSRGRVEAGKDNMGGSAAGRLSSVISGSVLGAVGGEETHLLTESELASHGHGVTDPGHVHTYLNQSTAGDNFFDSNPTEDSGPVTTDTGSAVTGITINDTGNDTPHNNVQPTLIVNKIIKATPVTFLSLIGVNLDFTGKAQADALGVTPAANDMGTYTGTLIPDNESAKENIQTLETAVEDRPTYDELYASSGAGLVRTIQAGTGAITRTVQDKLRETISVKDFGAIGDGIVDDTAAIQAALNYAGLSGGGSEVVLPPSSGGYRITSGLKLPSYVGIRGQTPSAYPFAAGNPNVSKIIADFSDVNQWVIEPDTRISGVAVAYNVAVTSLPNGATYNCSVRDLIITSVNTLPYGGIRMHGCPGSVVDNVAVYQTGTGLLVNYCFDGHYSGQFTSAYYGLASWGGCNANTYDVYAARHSSYTSTVPAGYLLPFMSALSATLTTTYNLSTNAHYNRAWGVIHGADGGDGSVNSVFNSVVAERFSGGVFLLNSLSTSFGGIYVEGGVSVVDTAIVSAGSTFSVDGVHAFLSGTGNLLDIGGNNDADLRLNGAMSAAAFGTVYLSTNSIVKVRGLFSTAFGPTTPQFNIVYEKINPGTWFSPTLINSWANVVGDVDSGYRKEGHRVYLNGTVNGGAAASIITTLPAGYRPYATVRGVGFTISSAGVITSTTTGPLSLTGFNFEQIG